MSLTRLSSKQALWLHSICSLFFSGIAGSGSQWLHHNSSSPMEKFKARYWGFMQPTSITLQACKWATFEMNLPIPVGLQMTTATANDLSGKIRNPEPEPPSLEITEFLIYRNWDKDVYCCFKPLNELSCNSR